MLRHVGMVTSALWSDVDGDGWPDLLLTLEWGQVKYFHNVGGKRFEDWTEKAGFASAGTGWWRSIATADFNGDGRPDYVVGNVGLNTQYHADPEHPALLFSGDFAGRGSDEIVEAYYENGQLYPWRSRTDLGAAFPPCSALPMEQRLRPRDAAGDPGSRPAGRGDAPGGHGAAQRRVPEPAGRPVPFRAPAAHRADRPGRRHRGRRFRGDGHADIYIVQNSYAPAPAIGRFDGGLSQLLRGDGHGHFSPVPPIESGLVVPGDAKALAVLDLGNDGWPGFLVSRNGEATLAFRNRGVAGRHSIRVVLQGPPGNPQAVGARVTAEYADGTTQAAKSAPARATTASRPRPCSSAPRTQSAAAVRVQWPSGATTTSPVWGRASPGYRALVAPEN
jgi:enediyne biosynthesis protein E4